MNKVKRSVSERIADLKFRFGDKVNGSSKRGDVGTLTTSRSYCNSVSTISSSKDSATVVAGDKNLSLKKQEEDIGCGIINDNMVNSIGLVTSPSTGGKCSTLPRGFRYGAQNGTGCDNGDIVTEASDTMPKVQNNYRKLSAHTPSSTSSLSSKDGDAAREELAQRRANLNQQLQAVLASANERMARRRLTHYRSNFDTESNNSNSKQSSAPQSPTSEEDCKPTSTSSCVATPTSTSARDIVGAAEQQSPLTTTPSCIYRSNCGLKTSGDDARQLAFTVQYAVVQESCIDCDIVDVVKAEPAASHHVGEHSLVKLVTCKADVNQVISTDSHHHASHPKSLSLRARNWASAMKHQLSHLRDGSIGSSRETDCSNSTNSSLERERSPSLTLTSENRERVNSFRYSGDVGIVAVNTHYSVIYFS